MMGDAVEGVNGTMIVVKVEIIVVSEIVCCNRVVWIVLKYGILVVSIQC